MYNFLRAFLHQRHSLLWHDLVQDLAHSLAGLGASGVAMGGLLHLLSHLLLHLHMEVGHDGSRRAVSVEAIVRQQQQ